VISIPPRPADFQFSEAKSPRLQIATYSDAARSCVVRGLTQKGLIHHAFTTNATRILQTQTIPLTEIPLSVHLETTTSTDQPGRLYARISLQITGVPVAILAAGYITTQTPLSWPEGAIRHPTDGPGHIYSFTGTSAGPGAEISEAVPVNTLWRIIGITYKLTTDAHVANRESIVIIHDGIADYVAFCRPTNTQAASLAKTYYWKHYNTVPATYNNAIAGQLPIPDRYISAQISTDTQNIQATDTYTEIFFQVEEWLSP
jgi:hypothetical protein